jgi:hypothetical protein
VEEEEGVECEEGEYYRNPFCARMEEKMGG